MAMRKLVTWTLATLAVHAALVAVTTSATFFRLSGETATRVFGGGLPRAAVFDDVDRHYYPYADRIVRERAVPYRDFVVEYPPLSLPAFVIPYLLAPTSRRYPIAFGAGMMLCDAALIALMAARIARCDDPDRLPARMAWTCVCVLGFGPLMIARYDLYPALLTFGGAILWSVGRPVAGGMVLGLGALAKIFPALLAGPLAVRTGSKSTAFRGMLGLLLTTAAGMGLWAALAGRGLIESLSYHSGRGFEVGSTYAGLLGAFAKLSGSDLRFEYLHSSMEIATPWAARLAPLAMPIQAAVILLVVWRAWGSETEEWPRFGAAILLAFIVAGKVLSPQYLIWLMPFLAVTEGEAGRRARVVFLFACLATALVFPWAQFGMVRLHPLALAILNTRNGLLVLLLGTLLVGRHEAPRGAIPLR